MLRPTVPLLLVFGLASTAGSVHASYLVTTQAQTQVEFVNATIQYGYNWGQPFFGTGFHAVIGCVTNAICSGAGTTDTVGNATSSFDQTSAHGHVDADPPNNVAAGDATGSAAAFGDLATAKIGVSATGTYLDYRFPTSGQSGGSGTSFAQIRDLLHFSAPGASALTPVDIGVTFTIDGVMTVTTAAGDSNGDLESFFAVDTAHYNDVISSGPGAYTPTLGTASVAGWVSSGFAIRTPGQIVFTAVYALTSSSQDVGISATLSDRCGLGTGCDYYHTGAIGLTLPAGTTFTSDSTVFLTQSSSAPEPASAGFLLAGLAVLTVVARASRPVG